LCRSCNDTLLGLSFISTDAVISGLCVAFSITIRQLYLDNNQRKELSKMKNTKELKLIDGVSLLKKLEKLMNVYL
jgi:hypothetical protein